jgi:hypothetical protein
MAVIAPPPYQAKAFMSALEDFIANPPRDLPGGSVEIARSLHRTLRGYVGAEHPSPGEREAINASTNQRSLPGAPGTRGTGEHYSKAARGVDGPSPGQREYNAAVGVTKSTDWSKLKRKRYPE